MENVDDADAGFSDIGNCDAIVWNQVHGSLSAPAPVSVPDSKTPFQHGSNLSRRNVPRIGRLPDSTSVSLRPLSRQASAPIATQIPYVSPVPPSTGIPDDLRTTVSAIFFQVEFDFDFNHM
ncbi:hypothetical protein RSAG8_12400, partial [Rhizoctonia solani AG-8 WAC10335]